MYLIETICLEIRTILFGVRGLANKHGFKDASPKTNNGKVANFHADSADFYLLTYMGVLPMGHSTPASSERAIPTNATLVPPVSLTKGWGHNFEHFYLCIPLCVRSEHSPGRSLVEAYFAS